MNKYKDGEPCDHKGCLSHVTHPCEGCGRVAGMAVAEAGGKVTPEEVCYIMQMEAWMKEMDALEKQIRTTIETSLEITEQNVIQLQWHLKRIERGVQEHADWIAKHDMTQEEYLAVVKSGVTVGDLNEKD